MASGGVSSPQCSTATAPISAIPDAESLMYGRFRTEKYAYAKCEIIITYKYVHIEREREGGGRGPLNPLSSLDLMLWKKDWGFELSICEI